MFLLSLFKEVKRYLPNFSALSALQIAQILRYGGWIMMGLLLTRCGMPLPQIAIPEYVLLISSFLSFFWVSGFVQYWLSSAPQTDTQDTYLFSLIFWVIAGSLLVSLIGFYMVYQRDIAGIPSVLFILSIPLGSLLDIIWYVRGKHNHLLVFSIAYAMLQSVLPLTGWLLFHHEEAVLWGMMITAAIKFLTTVISLEWGKIRSFDLNATRIFFMSSSPLLVSFFLSGIPEFSDAFIVQHFMRPEDFVHYRYGAREFPVMMLVSATFSTAMVLAVSRGLDTGMQQIRQQSGRLMHLFFPLSVLLLFLSPFAYPFLFGKAFTPSVAVFNMYLLLAVPRLIFPQAVLNGIKKHKIIMYSAALELVANISFSLLLMPVLGLQGIALGTVLAYCTDKLFLLGYLQRVEGISPTRYIPLRTYGLYILFLLGAFIVQNLLFLTNEKG